MEWSHRGLKVVYITEEPESVWAARLVKLPQQFNNVALVLAMGATQADIEATIQAGTDQVVIVDTIRLFRLSDENDNSVINKPLTPW
jgi:predicted ATP-dependent serine protease